MRDGDVRKASDQQLTFGLSSKRSLGSSPLVESTFDFEGSKRLTEGVSRPISVDLFTGVGGMSLGFEQAGFESVAAVEIDPIHACAYQFNFPKTTVIPSSIVGLSARDLRLRTGLGDRTVDVVYGGAPCQGFSMMGQRALDDPRNNLVSEFVRLVTELRARRFVFENVRGLTVGAHRLFLEELIASFDRAGYQVQLPWRVLNVADYGVPQNRYRLILFGALKGEKLPEYPPATSQPADLPEQPGGLVTGPTCSDALADLPDVDRFGELVASDSVEIESWGPASQYGCRLRAEDRGDWGYGYQRIWDPTRLTSSVRTDHTSISRRRFQQTRPGEVEPISRFFKLNAKGLANTLRAGTDSARGAFTSPRPIHYLYPRCISVREMARLHGFPDWFRFHVTKWHGARQIGNAVPPPLAREIASAVMASLGAKPRAPRIQWDLGDPRWLTFDMTAAANFFSVPVVIGRRDRKSGARKRKQTEIVSPHRKFAFYA